MNDQIIQRTAKLLLIAFRQQCPNMVYPYHFKFSRSDIKVVSGERIITDNFIEALEDEFSHLGWYMFDTLDHPKGDTTYAVMHEKNLGSMIKLGPKRVLPLIGKTYDELVALYEALEESNQAARATRRNSPKEESDAVSEHA